MSDPIVLHDDCDEVWIVKQTDHFMPSYKVTWLFEGEVKYKQTFEIPLLKQDGVSAMFDALLAHVKQWEQCEVPSLLKLHNAELARGWKQPFSLKRLPDEYPLLGGNNV